MRKNLSKETSKFSRKHLAADEIATRMRLTYQALYIVLKSPVCMCCSQFFLSQVIFVFLLFWGMVVYVMKKKKNENYLK